MPSQLLYALFHSSVLCPFWFVMLSISGFLPFLSGTKRSHTVNKLFLFTNLMVIKSFNIVSVTFYIWSFVVPWKITCPSPLWTCSACQHSVERAYVKVELAILSMAYQVCLPGEISTVHLYHLSVKIAYISGATMLPWKSRLPGYSPFC